MSHLVEKAFPFSAQAVQADTLHAADFMNQLVFALLECMGDNLSLARGEEKSSDIERLDHKINLVIFMLNNLIQPSQTRPAAHLLRLGADSLAWQSEAPLREGQRLLIELYLSPSLSLPLRCHVRIDAQKDGWVTAGLVGLAEDERAAWSKWVFRQHRQSIAQSREQEQRQSG
jgi:hypothetical protein